MQCKIDWKRLVKKTRTKESLLAVLLLICGCYFLYLRGSEKQTVKDCFCRYG
ncbi:MAG: hypothetical protein ACOX1Z_00625 [Candidatus Ratteibacteria bacterium]